MHIDRFKNDDIDGGYIDESGCHYDDAESFYQNGIFKMCGCGRAEDNLAYIRDGLQHIADYEEIDGLDDMQYDAWLRAGIEVFGNELSRYFFFYWLDSIELTEHGSSIPGWLTEKGKQVLEDLKEMDL